MTDSRLSFLRALEDRARARPRRIVFPEATEPRIGAAVARALVEDLFEPVLVGPRDAVRAALERAGAAPSRVRVVDPDDAGLTERCRAHLEERRRARGASLDGIDELAREPLMQAALLVAIGDADGAVAGSVHTTAHVIRAGLAVVGLAPGTQTVSSSFFMAFEPGHPMGPRVLTFTDAGVLPQPTAGQLADVAAAAARAHESVVGEAPRVAFLSYSTKGSAEGASVTLAREALARFHALRPDVAADGELQADAALVPSVAARKAPGSAVAGSANVLVFPDLAAANIAYKLVQHLAGAHALGPILQGLARPFNDLSRGATPDDIVSVACITALMAGASP